MTIHEQRAAASADVELRIAKVLLGGTIAGIVLLTIGVGLMITHGIDPEALAFPPFVPGDVVADMAALRPEGFLWAGIVILIATPILRVIGEVAIFTIRGDRVMAMVALAILGVIALSVVVALAVEV